MTEWNPVRAGRLIERLDLPENADVTFHETEDDTLWVKVNDLLKYIDKPETWEANPSEPVPVANVYWRGHSGTCAEPMTTDFPPDPPEPADFKVEWISMAGDTAELNEEENDGS